MATIVRTPRDKLAQFLTGYPAAVAVLATHFLLATASVRETPNTFDEIGTLPPATVIGPVTTSVYIPRTGVFSNGGLPCRC